MSFLKNKLISALLFISIHFMGQTIFAESISPSFAIEIKSEYDKASQKVPSLINLLQEVLQKANNRDPLTFLTKLNYCSDLNGQSGAMTHTASRKIMYFSRQLDEGNLKSNSHNELKNFYLTEYKEDFQKEPDLKAAKWKFEEDYFVLINQEKMTRQICLRKGISAKDLVPILAHEMIHYSKIVENDETDILNFKDLADFAMKSVLRVGDEVDAYQYQFSLMIKLNGITALNDFREVAPLFNERGDFVGSRENLAHFIMHNLGYDYKRLTDEYLQLAKAQLPNEDQLLKTLEGILDIRTKQAAEISTNKAKRSKILNFFSSKYREETKRLSTLFAKAEGTQIRLKGLIEKQRNRYRQLRAHIVHP